MNDQLLQSHRTGDQTETCGPALPAPSGLTLTQPDATAHARSPETVSSQHKAEFIAVLSHELRTPLHSVLGWVRVLQKDIAAETRARALQAIESNARAMAGIIDDLSERSRLDSGKFSLRVAHVDIGDVVREAVTQIRPLAQMRGVALHCHITASPTALRGDAGRLLQVVSNLLSNATKFTPAGGHVSVDVAREKGGVCIRVTDTGRGIERALLPRLFEPFQQGDDSSMSQQGLGLGLALVKEFVERHGGAVSASSEGRGLGATFIVMLPESPPIACRDHIPPGNRLRDVEAVRREAS